MADDNRWLPRGFGRSGLADPPADEARQWLESQAAGWVAAASTCTVYLHD